MTRAERRAALKLSRFADVIQSVSVTIRDINGPRGGIDVRCRVRVVVRRANDVIIQETGSTVMDAITGAFDRAARTVARSCERQNARQQIGPARRTGRPTFSTS